MQKKTETDKEISDKKFKPFQWFLYVVIIPLLFVITVVLIISLITGVNVFNEAMKMGQKIPVVQSLLPQNTATKISEKDLINLQAQVKDREAKISQLQAQLDQRNQDILRKQLDNKRLQQEIADLNTSQNQKLQQSKRALKDIVNTYETMSPNKAAPIIVKMSNPEALKILTSVKPDVLAAIMENMDAAQAARFTELMTKKNDVNQ